MEAKLSDVALPLSIYETNTISEIMGRDGTVFRLQAGLSKEHAVQLKKYSLDETDEALQNNTSDRKRFGEGSYEDWYSNSRVPFSVVDTSTNRLAAFIWFGPKPLGAKSISHLTDEEQKKILSTDAENWHTIAYRSYSPYRGVGIIKKAVVAATEIYLRIFPDAQLWAILDKKNFASLGLSKALGYEGIGEEDGFAVVVRK